MESKNNTKRILQNVNRIREKIKKAAERAGRDCSSVRLLAATKNRSVEEVREALIAGVDFVGENRVQELLTKCSCVGDIEQWHFIGHLQRNKAKYVIENVSLIHSIDSLRIASKVNEEAVEANKVQDVLIQVNVSGEETKYGLKPDEVFDFMKESKVLKSIRIKGLSTLAPYTENAEDVRWVFIRLRELGENLRDSFPNFALEELSMGMSKDFEVAVEEGSTIVRIGTAIFDDEMV
ncbi:MAG: YggS family pyridoxal phosphate-dependent enzyme [Actinomycetota bacterium]|nr:YggS family pyridoxal phosphate-dependent enzyme [Actinomycetota bacterium]